MADERRRRPRYNRADLVMDVARPGIAGFFRTKPQSKCLNFNRHGLRFGSNQRFAANDRLVMDLRIGDVALNELSALVVSCAEDGDHKWCTNIRFCFESKTMRNPEVIRKLLQIEDQLRCVQTFPFDS